jgi:hypothetical protein
MSYNPNNFYPTQQPGVPAPQPFAGAATIQQQQQYNIAALQAQAAAQANQARNGTPQGFPGMPGAPPPQQQQHQQQQQQQQQFVGQQMMGQQPALTMASSLGGGGQVNVAAVEQLLRSGQLVRILSQRSHLFEAFLTPFPADSRAIRYSRPANPLPSATSGAAGSNDRITATSAAAASYSPASAAVLRSTTAASAATSSTTASAAEQRPSTRSSPRQHSRRRRQDPASNASAAHDADRDCSRDQSEDSDAHASAFERSVTRSWRIDVSDDGGAETAFRESIGRGEVRFPIVLSSEKRRGD